PSIPAPRPSFSLSAPARRMRAHSELRRFVFIGAIKIGLTPEPPGPNKTIRTYRNAFTHNPVLGRAVSHGRELLPPEAKLPTRTRPLLWRDIEKIPASQKK